MIELQDSQGLVFWKKHEVSSLTPDFRNRWRAVRHDGSVAHRPTPPPPGPWVPLGASFVNPTLVEACAQGWRDRAGFVLGLGVLGQLGPEDPPVAVEGLDCWADQVTLLVGKQACWTTDLGMVSWPDFTADQVAARHPDLIKLGRNRYLNRRRIFRILMEGHYAKLVLDNGHAERVRLLYFDSQELLGLPNLVHLEPRCAGLYRSVNLRDWSYELARADGQRLQADFATARELIGNLIWQAYRYRAQGIVTGYGDNHRRFFYDPLTTTLNRAGFGQRRGHYVVFEELFSQFVARDRFFTPREFGFRDPAPHLRHLGSTRPQVLLVVEKDTVLEQAQQLAAEFGISYVVLGGKPSLTASEYLAEALRPYGPLVVLALVDFDPGGWITGSSQVDHLRQFGLSVRGEVVYLVVPELFSAEEIELYALPCKSKPARVAAEAAAWVVKSGGIGGKALSLLADNLSPERLRERMAQVLAALES